MSNKLYEENDIQNIANAIRNKNGTEDTYKVSQMSTAIDSIEVIEQATAEGESLSLTNTKAMPYSDYVVEGKSEQDGEPSPSNPSEIHSVADDVNLFDVGTISDYRNFYNDGDVANWFSINSNILNVIIQDSGATMFYNKKQYKGNENYTIKLKSSMVGNRIYIKLRNANNTDWLTNSDVTISNMTYNSYYKGWFYQSTILNTTLTISVPNCLYCCIGFGFASDNIGTTQTIENIKVQKGTTSTPYSPYNQGTVTIKQRGKNLFKIENFQKIGWNIAIKNPLKGLNPEKYTISCVNAYKEGIGIAIAFSNQPFDGIVGNYFTGYNFGDGNKYYNTQTITQEQIDAEYMRIMPSDNGVTQEILENMQIQIEEEGSTATPYEPYFANDYTFQTEPLRSLPNGVKDTMELQDMQNHTRIGRQTGTLTETTTITLSDAKTNGAYMCNIKPSGTLTGKTIELEAGDYEIIYELAEEIIEPLTQNQATTMLDIIKTGSYECTTNIYTDEDVKPTIGVEYYKKA